MEGAVGTEMLVWKDWRRALGLILSGSLCFLAAYQNTHFRFLLVPFLWCVLELAKAPTWRQAFYPTLGMGLLIYSYEASFFWNIFGPASIVLWLILSFWLAFFAVLARLASSLKTPFTSLLLLPVLWTGLEYFRSEVYPLKFSWFSLGYCWSEDPWQLRWTGVYGMGMLVVSLVVLGRMLPGATNWISQVVTMVVLAINSWIPSPAPSRTAKATESVPIAGLQMEMPMERELVAALDDLRRQHPESKLIVLSEYTLATPPTDSIRAWCQRNQVFLILGGKDPIGDGPNDFRNTAFVVGPSGETVFRQVKSVPIQFFQDGQPASKQDLWNSPWGKIGLLVCYDQSYRRVVDRLVKQGAQALIVISFDAQEWGQQEHLHHRRVARIRAGELQVPVFRVGNAGYAQQVDRNGVCLASTSWPGTGAHVVGTLNLASAPSLPWDHWVAPVSAFITGFFAAFEWLAWLFRHRTRPAQACA